MCFGGIFDIFLYHLSQEQQVPGLIFVSARCGNIWSLLLGQFIPCLLVCSSRLDLCLGSGLEVITDDSVTVGSEAPSPGHFLINTPMPRLLVLVSVGFVRLLQLPEV